MRIAKSFISAVLVVAFLFAAFAMLTERVPPATIGVKQNLWGGGVVKNDYDLGYHVGITGYHTWHFLDRRTHFLTYSGDSAQSNAIDQRGPLVIRTKDNNTATYDLTVTYQIIPGEAYKLVEQGKVGVYRDRVAKLVESEMREALAELSSEDIYSTDMRLLAVENAMPKLKTSLEEFGVEPEKILIRAVSFTAAYEEKLQEKQLTYQKRLLATAQERVERQKSITDTKEAEIEAAEKELRGDWDKELETLRSDNKVQIAEIDAGVEVYNRSTRATSDADYETMIAEGQLAIDKAEALRNELRNQALDTQGGRIYLAKLAADNLHFDHVTLNSNDPSVPSILNVDELVRMLIGSDEPSTDK